LIGLSCIIGGSLGNLTDRFSQGHVTDFLEFAFFSFPVFNVADTFINIGLGLVLIGRIGKGEESDTPGAGATDKKAGDEKEIDSKDALPATPKKS
jgi:lipoprotein signal peptidase